MEGKASSDEEEEEKTEEGLCCLTEVKKLINRLHSTAERLVSHTHANTQSNTHKTQTYSKYCSSPFLPRCPNPTVHHFLLSHNLLHDNDLVTSPRDGKGRGRKELCPAEERGNELQKVREK